MSLFASLRGRPVLLAIGGAALLALGGGAGALAVDALRPPVAMAPAAPIAIRALAGKSDDSIVTIRGRVAEVYGNKAIVADASGRMLVDLGREGEGGTLVAVGRPVTVQGRFDDGVVRAMFLVGSDGTVTALRGGRHGHDRDRRGGFERGGPDAPPPPPPAPVGPANEAQ